MPRRAVGVVGWLSDGSGSAGGAPDGRRGMQRDLAKSRQVAASIVLAERHDYGDSATRNIPPPATIVSTAGASAHTPSPGHNANRPPVLTGLCGGKGVEGIESSAQDGFGIALQPPFKHGGVNLSEIGVVLEVAVLQIVETWVLPDQTRLHASSREEHRAGGAVVRAFAGIFGHAPTELTEAQAQDAVAVPVSHHIVQKRADAVTHLP